MSLQHFHDADREGCTACQEPLLPAGFTMTDKGWWCADHGYGCEPQNCPCGHTLRCDCWSIANEC